MERQNSTTRSSISITRPGTHLVQAVVVIKCTGTGIELWLKSGLLKNTILILYFKTTTRHVR
jgi:hypothetical protein